jgi:GH24 family phage-related lysozyme (muramidase)
MEVIIMMSDQMKASLKHLIVSHEDYRRFPYIDTLNNVTFGIGYNATARGMTDEWINNQYDEDVNFFYTQLTNDYDWFPKLNEARQCALIDMCFMGYKKFQGFTDMISALEQGHYDIAAREALSSEWALEVKHRAVDIANILKSGEI